MAKTILSIDDMPGIRRLIRMTLEYMGFRVLEAENAETGLLMAREHRPDLVLMDVRMPGISGVAACAAMGEDPQLKLIPVVMLTSADRATDVAAGFASGAKAYLVKPFQPMELIELVARLTQPADGSRGNAASAPG
ncbi:MAG: response regulator [Rhodoferax sp.]|nr:response regulator [Rhodoferax sp.]